MGRTDLETRLARALSASGGASSDFDLNPGTVLAPGRVLTPAAVLVGIFPDSEEVLLTRPALRMVLMCRTSMASSAMGSGSVMSGKELTFFRQLFRGLLRVVEPVLVIALLEDRMDSNRLSIIWTGRSLRRWRSTELSRALPLWYPGDCGMLFMAGSVFCTL